tara:strand:- start:226 stop:402 length:177 start_codon:yes stop_codon:yes gene_type:complete
MGNDFKSKNSFLEGGTMSHPVNDEILENLYEEVKEEFPNALEPFVIAEVQKRFEEMSL